MNDQIVYYPYRTYKWFVLIMSFSGVIHLVAAVLCICDTWALSYLFAIIGGFSLYLAVVLYNTSTIRVVFNSHGLIIKEKKRATERECFWEDFSYAYYIRNYKGHLFLVLSYKKLDNKKAKYLVTGFTNAFKICLADTVVIYLDVFQDVTQIKKLAERHLMIFSIVTT